MNNAQNILIIALALIGALWFYNNSQKPKNNGATTAPGANSTTDMKPVQFDSEPVALERDQMPASRNPRIKNGSQLQAEIQRPVLRVS